MSHTQGPTSYSAIKLFLEGRKIASAEKSQQEQTKVGTLRAGNSGALVGEHVIGKCHRLSLARFLGLEEPKEDGTYCIFESGEANEDVWKAKVIKSWPGKVTGDVDYPMAWEIDGVKITGRPDLVFLGTDDKPEFLVELKVIESVQSAASLFYERKPKTDNLLQAAHYSLKFGMPAILVYTFSGKGDIPFWCIKKYNIPKGVKMSPFKMEFTLFWQDGVLGYVDQDGESVMTIITAQSIEDYYKLILDMQREEDLYLRASSLDVHGGQQPWNSCDYCSLNEVCNGYDAHGNFGLWVDEARREWNN